MVYGLFTNHLLHADTKRARCNQHAPYFLIVLHIAYNTVRKLCQRQRQIRVEVFVKPVIYLQFGS